MYVVSFLPPKKIGGAHCKLMVVEVEDTIITFLGSEGGSKLIVKTLNITDISIHDSNSHVCRGGLLLLLLCNSPHHKYKLINLTLNSHYSQDRNGTP